MYEETCKINSKVPRVFRLLLREGQLQDFSQFKILQVINKRVITCDEFQGGYTNLRARHKNVLSRQLCVILAIGQLNAQIIVLFLSYFMGCIALVRCVLVLRCGSAGVVWYPDAG